MNLAATRLWILAAGEGRRAGGPKGLMQVSGRSALEHAILAFRERGGRSVVIGLGAQLTQHYARLPWLPPPGSRIDLSGVSVEVVVNTAWTCGPFSTLQSMAQIERTSCVWVFPVDGSLPSKLTMEQILGAKEEAWAVVPQVEGRGGHPVLLDRQLYSGFVDLDPKHARLDVILKRLPTHQLVRIAVSDERVLCNRNHPGDWDQKSTA